MARLPQQGSSSSLARPDHLRPDHLLPVRVLSHERDESDAGYT